MFVYTLPAYSGQETKLDKYIYQIIEVMTRTTEKKKKTKTGKKVVVSQVWFLWGFLVVFF